MIRLLVLFLILWPAAMFAQNLPALYDVTGVASDDVLNVRTAPAASGDLVGTLAFDQKGVEVIRLSDSKTWGLINIDERAGWISMRYMQRVAGQADDAFPSPATCFGTEPFWSLTLRPGQPVEYEHFGNSPQIYHLLSQTWSANRRDRFSFVAAESGAGMTGIIARQECNDGMSDREYGLSLELLIQAGSTISHFSGCCSLR